MKRYLILVLVVLLLLPSTGFSDKSFDFKKESSGIIVYENVVIFPEPNALVQIEIDTLGKSLPQTKKDGALPVMIKFTAGGATLNTYGTIKVQGSSTAVWPKKNWTLKFYSDDKRTKSLKIKIGDSVASDKWIAKAEWIDPTMLRNGTSYRLWEKMVKSRSTFPQYEVDNAWFGNDNMFNGVKTGAQGFPKTHPAVVMMNNEHYGISMLTLGHDPDNFNIDKNNPKHMYLEFDARFGYTNEKTWEKFGASGIGTWIDGYYPENESMSKEQKEAIDNLGKLINGSQKDFKKNFDKYLDKINMIDMLLFIEVVDDWDAVAQDLEIVTYDLEKWYILPWDKDTTFGMWWNGKGILHQPEILWINYEEEDSSQKPWFKTYHAFKPEVEARYAELRDNGVFSPQGIYEITSSISKMIPNEMWEAEKLRWEEDGRPSLDETSTSQIITWFTARLEALDKHFNYKKRIK